MKWGEVIVKPMGGPAALALWLKSHDFFETSNFMNSSNNQLYSTGQLGMH